MMPHLSTIIAITLLGVAACSDLMTRTIPDTVVIALAVGGIALKLTEGASALFESLAAASLMFVVLAVLCARGALGGGDVKLAAAIALGLSPSDTWTFLTATSLAGGLLAGVYCVLSLVMAPVSCPAEAGPRHRLLRGLAAERLRIKDRTGLPYGVAIAVGGTLVLRAGLPS